MEIKPVNVKSLEQGHGIKETDDKSLFLDLDNAYLYPALKENDGPVHYNREVLPLADGQSESEKKRIVASNKEEIKKQDSKNKQKKFFLYGMLALGGYILLK